MHAVWQSAEQEIAVIGTYIDVVTGEAAAAPVATVPAAKRSLRFFGKRQEAEAPPAVVAGGASTFLETVFSKVEEIANPGTVTETPPLVLSEIVDLWKAGEFQA